MYLYVYALCMCVCVPQVCDLCDLCVRIWVNLGDLCELRVCVTVHLCNVFVICVICVCAFV